MKKLILISALLFSLNGWAEDGIVKLSCDCEIWHGYNGKFACKTKYKYSSVIIDKVKGTMTFNGKPSKLRWNNQFYYGGKKKNNWNEIELDRVSLKLRNKALYGGYHLYKCEVVEGI